MTLAAAAARVEVWSRNETISHLRGHFVRLTDVRPSMAGLHRA